MNYPLLIFFKVRDDIQVAFSKSSRCLAAHFLESLEHVGTINDFRNYQPLFILDFVSCSVMKMLFTIIAEE